MRLPIPRSLNRRSAFSALLLLLATLKANLTGNVPVLRNDVDSSDSHVRFADKEAADFLDSPECLLLWFTFAAMAAFSQLFGPFTERGKACRTIRGEG